MSKQISHFFVSVDNKRTRLPEKEREIDSVVFQQKLVKTFLYIKVVILY